MRLSPLIAACLACATPFASSARAEIHAELTEIFNGKATARPAKWTARLDWKWIPAEGGASVVQALVTITPPPSLRIARIRTHRARWLGKGQKSPAPTAQLQLATTGDVISVTTDDGESRTLRLELAGADGAVIMQGCEPFGYDLVRAEAAAPPPQKLFYLGLSCEPTSQGAHVTITAPKDVSWGSTSIFEIGGKGEQWRQYALTPSSTGDRGTIGRFTFTSGGAPVQILLVDKRASGLADVSEPSDEDRLVRFRVGGGLGRLAVSTVRLTDSLWHAGISLDGETRRFWGYLKAQASIDLALPLQTGSLGGDFFDLQASLKPEFRVKSFSIAPGIYFISLLGHYASGTQSFEFNQPGLGLELRWLRPRGSNVTLNVSTSGLVPSSSNTFLGLGAGFRFPQGTLGRFGVDLLYRQVGLAEPSGNATDTMSETLLNLVWAI